MPLVLLGRVTHAADDLKVVQAEKLQDFAVRGAPLLRRRRRRGLIPGPVGAALPLLLLEERVGHVLQRQAHRGLRQRALAPADGTLAPRLPLAPELLQARPAEAVAALEHHGLPEDLAADGAGELLLQHGARAGGDGPGSGRRGRRGRLGALEEGELPRLGGGSGPQRHQDRGGESWTSGRRSESQQCVHHTHTHTHYHTHAHTQRHSGLVYKQPGLKMDGGLRNRFTSLPVNTGRVNAPPPPLTTPPPIDHSHSRGPSSPHHLEKTNQTGRLTSEEENGRSWSVCVESENVDAEYKSFGVLMSSVAFL